MRKWAKVHEWRTSLKSSLTSKNIRADLILQGFWEGMCMPIANCIFRYNYLIFINGNFCESITLKQMPTLKLSFISNRKATFVGEKHFAYRENSVLCLFRKSFKYSISYFLVLDFLNIFTYIERAQWYFKRNAFIYKRMYLITLTFSIARPVIN